MSLISLALVLGSTISTCQHSGNANLLESITDDLINEAVIEINKFDYSNYELSLEQSQSFIQQKLYRFAEVNSLFDDTQLESLKKIIQEEDYFVNLGNIDKVFLRNENDFEIEFPFPGGDHEIPGPGINFPNIRPLAGENNFEFVTPPGGGGGTGGDSGNNNNLLEIKPVNESNISVSLAGSIQGGLCAVKMRALQYTMLLLTGLIIELPMKRVENHILWAVLFLKQLDRLLN